MGAYENPGTPIDSQSGNIWAQTIANIGRQTANTIKANQDRKAKEIKEARAETLALDKAALKYKNQIQSRIETFGGKSDSWFSMSNEDIDQKFYWTGMLNKAKTKEERQEASKMISSYDTKIRHTITAVKELQDFRELYGEESQLPADQANGIFTGNNNSDSKWSRGIAKNNLLKRALIGNAIDPNTKELIGEPTYYHEGGTIMVEIPGYGNHRVSDIISKASTEIEDWSKEHKTMFDELKAGDGIPMVVNGQISDAFLDDTSTEVTRTTTGKGNDKIEVIKTRTSYKPEVIEQFKNKLSAKALGKANSAKGQDDYDDMNATYLNYAGEGAKDLPYDGNYELTQEGKEMYAAVYAEAALKSNFGTPYKETRRQSKVGFTPEKTTGRTSAAGSSAELPERVKSVVNDFEKAIINDNVSFLKILDDKFKNVESDGVNLKFYIDKYEEKDANKVKSIKITDKKAMSKLATDYFKKLYQSETSLKERNINLPKIRKEIDRIINEKLKKATSERFPGASNLVNKEDNNKNTSVSDKKESGYLNK